MSTEPLKAYYVWDAPTRWFHWTNVVTVVISAFFGFLLHYRSELHIEGAEPKIALIIIHTLVGYAFVCGLLGRFVWGFAGNRYARWRAVLPNRQTLRTIGSDMRSLVQGQPAHYLGHSPLGRLSTTFLFFLLLSLAVSGLIRAGTDLYYPPLGWTVASYVAKPGIDPAEITPLDESLVDQDRLAIVKRLKSPVGKVHFYGSWALLAMIALHIFSVILKEIRQGGGIISAMFSGKKILARTPDDTENFDKGPVR
jgi:cytochrome b